MKKRVLTLLLALLVAASALTGCGGKDAWEQADSICVYLWDESLYDTYAPFLQSRLPQVELEFVVGEDDLDFYRFLMDRGSLPDVIACSNFSLHDAAPLSAQLMDLSANDLGSILDAACLRAYTGSGGVVNWLPLCGRVLGIAANKTLFDRFNVPLPTDYDSFLYACQAFAVIGIQGFGADLSDEDTCLALLQGLSASYLNSAEGAMWRTRYDSDASYGLDNLLWPELFQGLEQNLTALNGVQSQSREALADGFRRGKVAMMAADGAAVSELSQQAGQDIAFLPYYSQGADPVMVTIPTVQVALNKSLEADPQRKAQAMQVLALMLSAKGQQQLAGSGDQISYSKNVRLPMTPALERLNLKVDGLCLAVTSQGFRSASAQVLPRLLTGALDAAQAYQQFQSLLQSAAQEQQGAVLTVQKGYSNEFSKKGGVPAHSVMAASLRSLYGTQVLLAPASAFTGSVVQGSFTPTQGGRMVGGRVNAFRGQVTGAQLRKLVSEMVEAGFNRASLPVLSGLTMEVAESQGRYRLLSLKNEGKEIGDQDWFTLVLLSTAQTPPQGEHPLTKEAQTVRQAWTAALNGSIQLAQPEKYITLTVQK